MATADLIIRRGEADTIAEPVDTDPETHLGCLLLGGLSEGECRPKVALRTRCDKQGVGALSRLR